MNKTAQACQPDQRMSKSTLLAVLSSRIDYDQAIVVKTGQIIDIKKFDQKTINKNIKEKIWIYYEINQPRRMLLLNNNWSITSFFPSEKNVCVRLDSPAGPRVLNFTLNNIF